MLQAHNNNDDFAELWENLITTGTRIWEALDR